MIVTSPSGTPTSRNSARGRHRAGSGMAAPRRTGPGAGAHRAGAIFGVVRQTSGRTAQQDIGRARLASFAGRVTRIRFAAARHWRADGALRYARARVFRAGLLLGCRGRGFNGLFRRSWLVVGVDTGVCHASSCAGIPTVVLWSAAASLPFIGETWA